MNRWLPLLLTIPMVATLCVPVGHTQSRAGSRSGGTSSSGGVARAAPAARSSGATRLAGRSGGGQTRRSTPLSQSNRRRAPGATRSDADARRPPGARASRTAQPDQPQPPDIPGGTALITRPAEPQRPVTAPSDRAFRTGRTFHPYAYASSDFYRHYGYDDLHRGSRINRSAGDCDSVGRTGRRLTGGLQLQVQPGHAQVVVDGCVVGTVAEFDSVLGRLRLPEGSHWLDIWAEGYAPLIGEVRIRVGETVRYPGALRPLASLR